METNQKIIHNYILNELTQKEIDKFERAKIFHQYIQTERISVRECARRFNKDESTIRKFLLVKDMGKKQYDSLLKNGVSHDKICQIIKSPGKTNLNIDECSAIDIWLENTIAESKKFIIHPKPSKETENLIRQLIDCLNRTLIYVRQK